nr:hypothetical protein [Tanacetum cinerariifolium]
DQVRPDRPLRTVTEGQNELQTEESQVDVGKDGVEDRSNCVSERPGVSGISLRTDERHDDNGGEVERSHGEPGEDGVAGG